MEIFLAIFAAIATFILLLYAIFSKKRKSGSLVHPMQENDRHILRQHVMFYKQLDELKQTEFESRMQHFLATTRITGVNTEVERMDQLLVAASAIIPIFGFHNWEYMNLNEVLLYPDSFDEHFNQQGDERTRLGVVGDGPYQNIMILSRHELRQGFTDNTG